jgi:hypothetical protein
LLLNFSLSFCCFKSSIFSFSYFSSLNDL